MGGLALPAATRARLTWRPPTFRAAQSLFAGMPFSYSTLARVNRLLEWHERLAHRFLPRLGSAPPQLEFGAGMTYRTRREDRPHRAATFKGVEPQARRPGPLHPPTYAATPPQTKLENSPERWSADVQTTLQSHPIADNDVEIASFGPIVGEFPGEKIEPVLKRLSKSGREEPSTFALPSLPGLSVPRLTEAPSVPRPRLRLSTPPIPRREVTGAFPQSEPILADAIMVGPGRVKGTKRDGANENGALSWEAARQSIATAALRVPDVATNPDAKSPTAIERLLEQTRKPAPLPGLEIRLVRRSEPEEGDQRRPADARDRVRPNPPASPPPTTPPAPQLDINAVADKVHQILVRRQQFERERKGFY